MRSLLKLIFGLLLIFIMLHVSTDWLGLSLGQELRNWLDKAATISPWVIASAIAFLLAIDLISAMPTLTLTLLAGYFLGFAGGVAAAFTGMTIAGLSGYWIGRLCGDGLVSWLLRNTEERERMCKTFAEDGPAMILLSRGAPLLPEITACIAGSTRMRFRLWVMLHVASTLPYVMLAVYLGSISRTNDPMPTIFAAIVVYAALWIIWALVRRNRVAGKQ